MTAARQRTPWYVETFLAIGGWIAGLFAAFSIFAFAAFVVSGADDNADRVAAITALAVGGGFAAVGAFIGRRRAHDFARHFAIAAIVAGMTAATAGFWWLAYKTIGGQGDNAPYDAGVSGLATTALLAGVLAVLNWRVRDAILAFLSTLAVYGVLTGSLWLLTEAKAAPAGRLDLLVSPLFVLAGAALVADGRRNSLLRAAAAAAMIGPLINALLLAQANWLGLAPGAPSLHRAGDGVLFAALAWALLQLRTAAPVAVLAIAGLIGAAAAVFHTDYSVISLVILAAGMAARHRGLVAVGVIALAWSLGRYYYDLNLTLLTKSGIMAAMGVVTVAAALLLRREGVAAARAGAAAPRRHVLALLGAGAAFGAALYLVNASVNRLETGFDKAETIYLPLGPRDPRSLIQGDYMTLNFDRDLYPEFDVIETLPRDGVVFLKLDENRVARFSRLAGKGDGPDADEIRVIYIKTGRATMRYCAETFFFQEGDAPAYDAARFAVVKVAADGATRLVALADAERRIIDPAAANAERE